MRKLIGLIIVSALLASGSATAQQALTCAATELFVCNVGIGCLAGETGATWVNVYPGSKEYERCDAKGCDRYPAAFVTVGAFTNIELAGRGAFAKLGPEGFFSEVVTATMTIVSYGKCKGG